MNDRKYTSIQSEFIKQKLAGKSWSDRKYVNDLIVLYKFVSEGYHGHISAIHFGILKEQYEIEYLSLLKEVSVPLYEKEVELKTTREKELAKGIKNQILQEEFERADWISAGGKP